MGEIHDAQAVERYIATHANGDLFWYLPWLDHGRKGSALAEHVLGKIREAGYWENEAEVTMAIGMYVKIEGLGQGGSGPFRVTGGRGRGVQISGTFGSVERALDMGALFANLQSLIVKMVGWQ